MALSPEEYSQVHLALLTLSLEKTDILLRIRLSDSLREDCSTAHRASISSSTQSSRLHMSVSQTLTEMSISHENEFVAAGVLSVDIFIKGDVVVLQQEDNGKNHNGVVIEVDGPVHYLRCGIGNETGGKRTTKVKGEYLLKDRLLEKQGYKVLHVPYYDWDKLKNDEERMEYLMKLLMK